MHEYMHRHFPMDENREKPEEEIPKGRLNRLKYKYRKNLEKGIKAAKTYFRLLTYAKPYLFLAFIVLVLSGVSSITSLFPTQIMGVAIDEINLAEKIRSGIGIHEIGSSDIKHENQPARSSNKTLPVAPLIRKAADYVWKNWMPERNRFVVVFGVLTATFLFFHLFENGISVVRGFIMTKLGNTLTFDMRNNVYDHIQQLSLRYFEDRRTGDIMSRIVNDIDSLQDVIVGPVIWFITDMIRLVGVLYFCLSWDWVMTVLALLVSPVLVSSTMAFGMFMRKKYILLRQKIGELNSTIQDNISGIRTIKGFAREDYEYKRFNNINKENRDLHIQIGYLNTIFHPVIGILMEVGAIIVLLYGGIKVLRGEMTAGMFVVFFPYVSMLNGPIMGINRFFTYIIRALASVDRVFEVLDTKPEVADKEDAIELPPIKGYVEFQDVCFSYTKEVEVLKNVSFKCNPGQMVAFVGPSGAGKSTAISMVARFYDPTSGKILVDGYDLRDVKQISLRKQMGIVLQDPFLFNDTVKNNIAYGKLGATDEEIIEAAKAANAHDFILELPNSYETVIGERGIKLSGGQKQRISIARAILADPRILILDEATSSVDTETEMLIQTAIQRLVANRTTFVIAHRLSTVHNADLIIVLDKGNVVEMGKHKELIINDGLYSRLYKIQFRIKSLELEEEKPEVTLEELPIPEPISEKERFDSRINEPWKIE
ncbi:MAG: ABC transporter ATP-binding protein [bacterium]